MQTPCEIFVKKLEIGKRQEKEQFEISKRKEKQNLANLILTKRRAIIKYQK